MTEYFDIHILKVDKYISYETAPRKVLVKILIHIGSFEEALKESTIAMKSIYKVPLYYELYIESLALNKQMANADKEIVAYIDKIQDGYENENIIRLKALIKRK